MEEEHSDGSSYYAILNVAKDASSDDIKKAFKSLATVWHPDKQPGASDEVRRKAAEVFSNIQEAHEVLTDPVRRQVSLTHMPAVGPLSLMLSQLTQLDATVV